MKSYVFLKSTYVEHKTIRGAQGVKVCGKDLDKVVAGLNMEIAYHPDEVSLHTHLKIVRKSLTI